MCSSTQSRYRRCQSQKIESETFLPIVFEDQSLQDMKPHSNYPLEGDHKSNMPAGHIFLQDATSSFEEASTGIRKGIKEYHCLQKALCLYLISMKMNIISSTHLFFNFFRIYPTIVGWLFLVSKFSNLLAEFQSGACKLSRSKDSTSTCDTISSDQSQESLSKHLNEISQSWGQFTDIEYLDDRKSQQTKKWNQNPRKKKTL